MASSAADNEISRVFLPSYPMFKVYKDGHYERLRHIETVPPSDDPITGVKSKDVVVSQQPPLSARLFLPKTATAKIPLLIYIHGGAFCIQSPFSPTFHNYLTSLVNKANIIAVSIDYRLAPEFLLPVAYDDAWAAIEWVALHSTGNGADHWLNNHADYERVFVGGDSAGANIAHNVMMRMGSNADVVSRFGIAGMVLMNPFFMNDERDELIEYIFPSSGGGSDPRMNPAANAVEELGRMACGRVLVCVAEKDFLRERGVTYYEAVKKSAWNGEIDIVETPGEGHVFYLFNPTSDKAIDLMNQVSFFLNRRHLS